MRAANMALPASHILRLRRDLGNKKGLKDSSWRNTKQQDISISA
jgi:hypothetical protein